jgi:hypothetical protein
MMVVVKMDTPRLYENCKTEYTFLEKKNNVIVLLLYLQGFTENKNQWSVLWKFYHKYYYIWNYYWLQEFKQKLPLRYDIHLSRPFQAGGPRFGRQTPGF